MATIDGPVGQLIAAKSVAVVLASDQTPVPVASGASPLVLDSFGANPAPISIVLTSITGTSQCRGTIDYHEYR